MADKYEQAFIREITTVAKSGRNKGKKVHKAWKGVLKYREDNPNYVEDQRTPEQRREFLDRAKAKPNPLYVADTREPNQKNRFIWRQVAATFDPDEVRTKTDATNALVAWRATMEEKAKKDQNDVKVLDYIEQFIANRLDQGIIEKSTARDYRHTAKRLEGGFKDVCLADLTREKVEKWEASETRRGISPTTTTKAHRLLFQVCQYACQRGVIPTNPVFGVEPPRRAASKPNALDEEGVRRLTGILALMEATPLSTAAFLALHAGLRQGECCGLRWRDVDLDNAEIHITQSIGIADGGAYAKPPKTAKSARDIPIDAALVAKLEQRQATMKRDLMRGKVTDEQLDFNDLYVCGSVDGRYLHPTQLSRKWALLAEDYGLIGTQGKKVVFTDLRHTYATIAVRGGADIANISANMGHSSTKMTLDVYSSPTREGQRAVADRIGAAMEPVTPGQNS